MNAGVNSCRKTIITVRIRRTGRRANNICAVGITGVGALASINGGNIAVIAVKVALAGRRAASMRATGGTGARAAAAINSQAV